MDVFFGFIKWIEDWKKEDIDYMSNCTLVLVGVTLVSVVALYYFGIRPEMNEDNFNYNDLKKDLYKDEGGQFSKGSSEIFAWIQNDKEFEFIFYVNSVVQMRGETLITSLNKKNVSVEIKQYSLKILINGNVFFDELLSDAIDPSESSWQIDDISGPNSASEPVVWVTLFKKKPTSSEEYWKSPIRSESNNIPSSAPIVKKVDPSDKTSIKEAVVSLKDKKKL